MHLHHYLFTAAALCGLLATYCFYLAWRRSLRDRARRLTRARAHQARLLDDYRQATADLELEIARIAYTAAVQAELAYLGALSEICDPLPFESLSQEEQNHWLEAAKKHLCRS